MSALKTKLPATLTCLCLILSTSLVNQARATSKVNRINHSTNDSVNNINNKTDNTPVTLSRDQNITNHLTQKQNVESINVVSVSIDNSVTNSTNNPASV